MNNDAYIDTVNLQKEISKIKLRLNKEELYLNFDVVFEDFFAGYKTDNLSKLEEIQNEMKLKIKTLKKNQNVDLEIIYRMLEDIDNRYEVE